MSTVAKLVRRPVRIRREPIHHDWPMPDTLMGIELEAESGNGASFDQTPPNGWNAHRDGSLVSGVEFTLSQPLAGSELRTAINEVFRGNTFTRSMTGSTHIHMDMLSEDTTEEVLRVMVLLVYCLESMLYAVGDAGREWCGFANRLRSGPDNVVSVVLADELEWNSFNRNYHRNNSQFGRYYGLNMAALLDYGSLEFRYFPTATSEEEMIKWVELVQLFKKAAIALGTVDNLRDIMTSEDRFNTFLQENFGKFAYLFPSLESFHTVRSDFQKALITAKVSREKKTFDGRKVFGTGKYSKFVKKLPSPTASITLYGRDSNSIPNVHEQEVGNLLIYNQGLYVALHGEWMRLNNCTLQTLRESPRIRENLVLLHQDSEAMRNIAERERMSIQRTLTSLALMEPLYTTSDPFAPVPDYSPVTQTVEAVIEDDEEPDDDHYFDEDEE